MDAGHSGRTVFAAGATAVRRDVLRGRVWAAAPHRVVRDSGGELVLAYWPGIESLAPTTWIEWLGSGDDALRKQAIPNLARGQWELGRWVWRDTIVLSWFGADQDLSVHRYWDSAGTPLRWYVNFERPFQRTRIGIDTFDLLLDLVIRPGRRAPAPSLRRWPPARRRSAGPFPCCPRTPWPFRPDGRSGGVPGG
jgi:Protein of unknown function (DUF402)